MWQNSCMQKKQLLQHHCIQVSKTSAMQRLHGCFSNLQNAEKHLQRAKRVICNNFSSREDLEQALDTELELALELRPNWEPAIELKARALLYLKKYKHIYSLLQDYVPRLLLPFFPAPASSAAESPLSSPSSAASSATSSATSSSSSSDRFPAAVLSACHLSVAALRESLLVRHGSATSAKLQWRFLVLGQACFHLGMLEDAIVLLQTGKRAVTDAARRHSNRRRDDRFYSDNDVYDADGGGVMFDPSCSSEAELVSHMISTIKFLLRRKAAAMASLEAGLYTESARHFSKIIDGRRGVPQGFLADCYLHRAMAYKFIGRVVDAIADCNKTIALSPNSAKGLSLRASLYESVRCFSECLLDLQQLKMSYTCRNAVAPDVADLSAVCSRMSAVRQRLSVSGVCGPAAACQMSREEREAQALILDVQGSYDSLEDVERAFLIISLKHRPEKATYFLDRCEFVDLQERGIDAAREEAQASANRLSQLIHRAYTKLHYAIANSVDHSNSTNSITDHHNTNHTNSAIESLCRKSNYVNHYPSQPSCRSGNSINSDQTIDTHTQKSNSVNYVSLPPMERISRRANSGSPSSMENVSQKGNSISPNPNSTIEIVSQKDKYGNPIAPHTIGFVSQKDNSINASDPMTIEPQPKKSKLNLEWDNKSRLYNDYYPDHKSLTPRPLVHVT